jgi:hypothetical protein
MEIIKIQRSEEIPLLLIMYFLNINPQNEMCKSLFTRKSKIALDIGCRFPFLYIYLYHYFSFKKFYGVDIDNEFNCTRNVVNWWNNNYIKKENDKLNPCDFNNWHQFYLLYCRNPEGRINDEKDFDFHFKKNMFFETKIENFIRNERSQFDFINAENILHLIKQEKDRVKVLKYLAKSMNDSSFINIRIQKGGFLNNWEFYDLVKSNFKDGKLFEIFDKDGSWYGSYYRNFPDQKIIPNMVQNYLL